MNGEQLLGRGSSPSAIYIYNWYLDQVPIIKSFSSICPVAMEFALMRMTPLYDPVHSLYKPIGHSDNSIQTLVLTASMTSGISNQTSIYICIDDDISVARLSSRSFMFHASYILGYVGLAWSFFFIIHLMMLEYVVYFKGHFTHETEGPWSLHFKHSH